MASEDRQDLFFNSDAKVELYGNYFIGVKHLLMFDDTPLISTTPWLDAGYTTALNIFSSNGDKLAVCTGTRLILTDDGKKAGLTLLKPDKMTVCKLGDQTLFEVRRESAAALKMQAELYTPTGTFLMYRKDEDEAHSTISKLITPVEGGFNIAGKATFIGNTKVGGNVGIHVWSNGNVAF
jgi:hypothetical protein